MQIRTVELYVMVELSYWDLNCVSMHGERGFFKDVIITNLYNVKGTIILNFEYCKRGHVSPEFSLLAWHQDYATMT